MFNWNKQRNFDFSNISKTSDKKLISANGLTISILIIASCLLLSLILTTVIITVGDFENRLLEKCMLRVNLFKSFTKVENCFVFLSYIFSIYYDNWKNFFQNQIDFTSNSYLGTKLLIGSSPLICAIVAIFISFKNHANRCLKSPENPIYDYKKG